MSNIKDIWISPTFLNGDIIEEEILHLTNKIAFGVMLRRFIFEKRDKMALIRVIYENGQETLLMKKTDGTLRDENGKEVYLSALFAD